jgi:hypothetical protein
MVLTNTKFGEVFGPLLFIIRSKKMYGKEKKKKMMDGGMAKKKMMYGGRANYNTGGSAKSTQPEYKSGEMHKCMPN